MAGGVCGEILLREARDTDARGVIAIVTAAYAEHPGCILDVETESPELKTPASSYALRAGRFWVAVGEAGLVLGCVACQPALGGGLELQKLYVARAARRRGLGARLLGLVEAEARTSGAGYITLWSDTRFEASHRFYRVRGFGRAGLRRLQDMSRSVEYGFRKDL